MSRTRYDPVYVVQSWDPRSFLGIALLRLQIWRVLHPSSESNWQLIDLWFIVALEGLVESFRQEIDPEWKIELLLAEVGGFKTDGHGRSAMEPITKDYEHLERSRMIRHLLSTNDPKVSPGDPIWGAKTCADYTLMGNPPSRLMIGQDAWEECHAKIDGDAERRDAWKDVALAKRPSMQSDILVSSSQTFAQPLTLRLDSRVNLVKERHLSGLHISLHA